MLVITYFFDRPTMNRECAPKPIERSRRSSGRKPMTKFAPPVVVRSSRIAETVQANSLHFLRVQNVKLQARMGGRSKKARIRT